MTMVAGVIDEVMVVADGGSECDPDESKCGSYSDSTSEYSNEQGKEARVFGVDQRQKEGELGGLGLTAIRGVGLLE